MKTKMKKRLYLVFAMLICIAGSMFAQDRTITGMVTSAEDGAPLPGVNILVSGTTNVGTVSDINGRYSLKVPSGYTALDFSYVGMTSQKIEIGASAVINVTLEPSAEMLTEVVVTALGIKKEVRAIGFSQQELNSDELSAAREANLNSFLTGKVSGVQITKTSSGSTGSSAITIRGAKSLLGNNQPLYVVDGVPITNFGHNSGGGWGDTDLGDGIGDLNPEDVESMSVLKGPNASALYGARGSNGVILITTKTGKKKKGIGVEVNSNVSFETLNLFPTFQNKYATGYEETNLYGSMVEIPAGSGNTYETMDTWHGDSWGPPLDGRRTIVNPFEYPENMFTRTMVLLPQPVDNVKDFYETGVDNSNTLSISGGNEKTTARLSIGNSYTKGIIPNWRVNKQTVTLRATSQVTDRISFDGKINYIHESGSNRPALGTTSDNVTRTFVTMGRYVPMDWLKEYYETTKQPGHWPGVNYNPYYIVNELKNNDSKDRIIGYVSSTINLTSWLNLMGRVGTDFYTQTQDRKWPIGAFGADNNLGRYTKEIRLVKDINADVILSGTKEISGNFSISGSLGSSILYQDRNTQMLDGRDFKAPEVYDISNCQDIRPENYPYKKEMQSVYFTAGMVYKNFWFVDVTGRNDWSSALGRNNYSFFYPSVSTSFVFTDAFDLVSKNVLSFGKIRASWAQVGNDSDPYLTQNGYSSITTTFNGQGLSSMNETIPLYNLKNELTESWELGADLRFLNNRFGIDFTYYNGKTTNQILPVQVSIASGYQSVVINAGEVDNKGIELTVDGQILHTGFGLTWDVTANYSRNHSNVVKLAPGIESLTLADDVYPNVIEARVGQPYGNIVGYAYQRAPDGQLLVADGGYYQPTSEQRVLGNITPKWIGGLNNTISFKGFSLNVLFDFVQGNQISSSTKYQEEAKGTGVWTVEGRRPRDIDDNGNQLPEVGLLPGVQQVYDGEGNVTGYKPNETKVNGQTYWAMRAWGDIGEEFVLNGSYISLREVMLSYTFTPKFLQKTKVTGLTLSAIGRNLAYLEEHMQGMGISPESAPNTSSGHAGTEMISMPTTRTWGINLKVNF
jgi:TonB-linked SusC/RagA family outer membrane protein